MKLHMLNCITQKPNQAILETANFLSLAIVLRKLFFLLNKTNQGKLELDIH
jgi:hypothetical protein